MNIVLRHALTGEVRVMDIEAQGVPELVRAVEAELGVKAGTIALRVQQEDGKLAPLDAGRLAALCDGQEVTVVRSALAAARAAIASVYNVPAERMDTLADNAKVVEVAAKACVPEALELLGDELAECTADVLDTALLQAVQTPLEAMCAELERRSIRCALLLVRAGARPTKCGGGGGSPLHYCSKLGCPELMRLLLDAAPRQLVDKPCRKGEPPLYAAASMGHVDVVRVLLEWGANVSIETDHGTALHAAAFHGHPEVVGVLLKAGARVDAAPKMTGATPLHDAVLGGRADVVRVLIDAGADPNQPNAFNETPLQLATSGSGTNDEIAEALRLSKLHKLQQTEVPVVGSC